jgi:murein L,D-transpeptidase YafK
MSIRIVIRIACVAAAAALLGGCPGGIVGGVAPALKQIPAETQVLLAKGGMTQEAPIFVRIFKEESQLEIWKQKADGRYHLFKTYPICNWSGGLGPKVNEGDKQSPEGFYTVTPGQMNPNSQFHLAFNLGYPNTYDKVNGRTGAALMVHGDCRSAGCYAMTDALIEEIYALAREAFRAGQTKFQVHAFPFRMTEENMKRHRNSKWHGFWRTLKAGYDDFELTRLPPKVTVCSRQYLVNADFFGHVAEPDPASTCPAYRRVPGDPFNPFGDGQVMANAQTPRPAANSRVAAYAPQPAAPEPSGEQAEKREAPQDTPDATQSVNPPSAVSSASAVAAPSAPLPVVIGQSVGPAAAFAAPATPAQPQQAGAANVTTSGLHNVVESRKGDMIAPAVR